MDPDQIEIAHNLIELRKILSEDQRFHWKVEFIDGEYSIKNNFDLDVPVQMLGSDIEKAKSNLRWLKGLED